MPTEVLDDFNDTRVREQSIQAPCSSGNASFNANCFSDAACSGPPDRQTVRATARLQWQSFNPAGFLNPGNVAGQACGTAFLISRRRLLIAGHCLKVCTTGLYDASQPLTPISNSGAFVKPQALARLLEVQFGYQTQTCGDLLSMEETFHPYNTTKLKVTRLVEYKYGNVDYAIIEVEGEPGAEFGYLSGNLAFNQGNIHIVQHPLGAPKKVEYGYGQYVNGKIQYKVNTLEGSSGAAIACGDNEYCGLHIQGGIDSPFNYAVPLLEIYRVSPFLQQLNYRLPRYQFVAAPKKNRSGEYVLGISLVGVSVAFGIVSVKTKKKNKPIFFVSLLMMIAAIGSAVAVIADVIQTDHSSERNSQGLLPSSQTHTDMTVVEEFTCYRPETHGGCRVEKPTHTAYTVPETFSNHHIIPIEDLLFLWKYLHNLRFEDCDELRGQAHLYAATIASTAEKELRKEMLAFYPDSADRQSLWKTKTSDIYTQRRQNEDSKYSELHRDEVSRQYGDFHQMLVILCLPQASTETCFAWSFWNLFQGWSKTYRDDDPSRDLPTDRSEKTRPKSFDPQIWFYLKDEQLGLYTLIQALKKLSPLKGAQAKAKLKATENALYKTMQGLSVLWKRIPTQAMSVCEYNEDDWRLTKSKPSFRFARLEK